MAENLLIPKPAEQENKQTDVQTGFGEMLGNLQNNAAASVLGNNTSNDASANTLKNFSLTSTVNTNLPGTNIKAEDPNIENEGEKDEDENKITTTIIPGDTNPEDMNPGGNPNGIPPPVTFEPPPEYGEDINPDQPLTDDQKQFYKWGECVTEFTNTYKAFAGKQNEPFEKWIRQQLKDGWHPNDPIPALTEIITYPGKGEYYSKEVDAINIVADSYSIARKYTYTNEYYGFWFYINAKTGWKSELQQRDAVAKYYVMNPISGEEMQHLMTYVQGNNIDPAYKNYSLGDLTKLQSSDEQSFRKLIEKVQLNVFKTSTINGYGLYTPQTREKLVPAKKEVEQNVSTDLLPEKPMTEFKKMGIVKSLEGLYLRQAPYTEKDATAISADALAAFHNLPAKLLDLGTRVSIQKQTSDGWYFVKTEFGDDGYLYGPKVETNMPDDNARYYLVKEGDTALKIVHDFYSVYSDKNIGQVQSIGQDFRNYVNKLAEYNKGSGIAFPKENADKKEAWANVVVKKNMLIWIPSSATMYNMVKQTSGEDLYGQNWIADGLQALLDYTPNNQVINKFLELWDQIPQEEKEKNITLYYKSARAFIENLRFNTPGWVDSILVFIPGAYTTKTLVYFLIEFEVGYLDYLLSLPPSKLVMSFKQYLFNQTQLDYYKGLMEGIGEGVVGWFADIIKMVKDIVEFCGKMMEMQDVLIARGGQIGKQIVEALEYIQTGEGQAELYAVFESFSIFSLFEGLEAMIGIFARKTGANCAEEIIKFMNRSPFEMGKGIGYIIGYLIPEILLLIFSEAIGNAIKWIFKGVQVVIEILGRLFTRLATITIEALMEGLAWLSKIGEGFKGLIMLLKKSGKEIKFLNKLDELFEGLEKFLKNKADKAKTEGKTKVGLEDETIENTKTGSDKTTTEGENNVKNEKTNTEGDNTNTKDGNTTKNEKTVGNGDRTLEELAPGGKIPKDENFAKWWNELSEKELEKICNNPKLERQMNIEIRKPTGEHEWFMVAEVKRFKKWGMKMEDIKYFRTKTKELIGTNPYTGEKFVHTLPNGKTGPGAGKFHGDLRKIIIESNNVTEFNLKLADLVKRWKIDPGLLPPYVK